MSLEIPGGKEGGGGGALQMPQNGNSLGREGGGGGGGGEQKNSFRFGGVDIFWNYITLERFLNSAKKQFRNSQHTVVVTNL